MSDNGGTSYGPNDPTTFGLQPPRRPDAPGAPGQGGQPAAPTPPPSPYAQPTQVVPNQSHQPHQPSGPSVPDPGAGRLIAGRYRLLSKLGHGGMGTVWRAKDETVDREVAVKEPRVPDHLPERERTNAFERMRREARAAARLDHPAVVNVHDVAVEDGQPWIVMEFVQGRSLGDALQEGTLSAREAARVGLEVLNALDAAHQAGILHRDVKPDNVMLGRHDRVVLTDFGIAQIEGETNLTDTGGFVGSPEFIAPERVLGQRPGPASDLWSLGVVLYAATEGVSPFRRSNTPATLQSVLNATPAAPATATGPLADAINGLLAKDPAHRPNAAQVRGLLEEAVKPPQQLAATQFAPLAGADGSVSPAGAKGGVTVSRKALLGIGAAVVAVVVAGVLVVANPFKGDEELAGGLTDHQVKELGATVTAPTGYKESKPGDDALKTDHWVQYTDASGSIWVSLSLDKKAEDSGSEIAGSAAAEMYEDDADFKETGDSNIGMDAGAKTKPEDTKYKGEKAALNTAVYQTTDSQDPRPRELQVLYYKTKSGDMYRLMIGYPGKGDFTERGRDVAKAAIDNLDITKL
ncbi:serine/threonine-protein kinase [Actinomycetota bacterium Odt1-20B]